MKGRKPIAPDDRGMVHWHVTSGYGGNTKQPFVEVTVGDWSTQMSPEAARALALNFLQAAEAAESDAAIVAFAAQMELGDAGTVALLRAFRATRERRHGDLPPAA